MQTALAVRTALGTGCRRAAEFARTDTGQLTLLLVALTSALLWVYWPSLATMAERWSTDPQYSHGFLVPIFALAVLWARWDHRPRGTLAPNWWGANVLLLGFLMRLAGSYLYLESLEAFSLLPTVAGLILLVGGWPALRWTGPSVAFLAFMLPLPHQVEVFLAQPLRRLATVSSTYLLQTLGIPAVAEGNIILIDQLRLGVVEACSGLGMLVTFFALATAVALVVRRPPLDRALLVVSAVPIAVLANVLRITATALAHNAWGPEVGNAVMHDLAGWLMMPLALGLLWLELRYLDRMLVPAELTGPLPIPEPGPQPEAPPVWERRAAVASPGAHPPPAEKQPADASMSSSPGSGPLPAAPESADGPYEEAPTCSEAC